MKFSEYIQSYCYKILQPYFDFKRYPSSYKNYFHVFWKRLSKKYPIDAILKDGSKLRITNKNEFRISKESKKNHFYFQNDLLIINNKNLPEIKMSDWENNGGIASVFFDDEYGFLPVPNKIVVDVGANIGDTLIYFALKGAEKVIGIEPLPQNYESAKKNIQLNGLMSKIDLQLAGCSNKTGYIQINDKKVGRLYSVESEKDSKVRIPLITLDEICKKNDIHSGILKIDCEGCEYEVILSTSRETLRSFSDIQIEYHFGYKNLKNKLEKSGFKVKVTKPKIGETQYMDETKSFFGFMYAHRV